MLETPWGGPVHMCVLVRFVLRGELGCGCRRAAAGRERRLKGAAALTTFSNCVTCPL